MERGEQERRATPGLSDAMKLEYNYLRERLLQNARIRTQIFGISIAAVGVSMSIGIVESTALVFLVPIAILIATLYHSIGSYHIINRIGTYIRCFFETPETDLRWETRLAQFRQIEQGKHTKEKPPVRWTINALYHFLILVNITLFVLYLSNLSCGYQVKRLIFIRLFTGWIINIFLSMYLRQKYRTDQYKEYLDKWEKIREKEEEPK